MPWTLDQLRRLPGRDPLAALEELQLQAGPADTGGRKLPRLSLWLEGGAQVKGEFLGFQRQQGLALLQNEGPGADILLVRPERIVAVTFHYDEPHLRRQLEGPGSAPGREQPTRLGLRRELEAWSTSFAQRFGYQLPVEVDWESLSAPALDEEGLHFLGLALQALQAELSGLNDHALGREALQELRGIRVAAGPHLSLRRQERRLVCQFALEGGLVVVPPAFDLRRALEKAL